MYFNCIAFCHKVAYRSPRLASSGSTKPTKSINSEFCILCWFAKPGQVPFDTNPLGHHENLQDAHQHLNGPLLQHKAVWRVVRHSHFLMTCAARLHLRHIPQGQSFRCIVLCLGMLYVRFHHGSSSSVWHCFRFRPRHPRLQPTPRSTSNPRLAAHFTPALLPFSSFSGTRRRPTVVDGILRLVAFPVEEEEDASCAAISPSCSEDHRSNT